MSYRSLKHVLGETHLERKCLFLFGTCLLALITGSFFLYGSITENLVLEKNRERGRLLVNTSIGLQHIEKLETRPVEIERDPDKVFKETYVKPFIEDVRNQEYKWRFLKKAQAAELPGSLGVAVRQLFLAREQQDSKSAETPVEFIEHQAVTGEYEYYQPVYAKKICADCHNVLSDYTLHLGGGEPAIAAEPRTRFEVGDVMYVARVSFPNEPTQQSLAWNRAVLLGTAIFTVFLAMVASYVIIRYVIVKPVNHLREVSEAISHGDQTKRAEIHTGDEYEELGGAFNRMLGFLVASQDEQRQLNKNLDQKVDELAQLNMQLFEANRLKSDFLATMSHELRTPLNSILGFSDVLGAIDGLDERQKRYVQNIQKSGKSLLDMINDILDLAKIEAGRTERRLSEFRIEAAVSAQCDMARPLSERKNIDIVEELPGNLPELYQDQAKLQQILNNLLSNAIKFTPEGGRVVVRADKEGGDLVLSVADTGVGIAPEDQQHVFEKFRQGKVVLPGGDAMTREYSGTGLGLSIVRELCKLLGGEVSLVSELGKGSTFTVRLPWELSAMGKGDVALADADGGYSARGNVEPARGPVSPATASR